MSTNLSGVWTYRSYLNSTALVNGDAAKALADIFGEGVFTFANTAGTALKGTLDMGGGYVLDLEGSVHPAAHGASDVVSIRGLGRPETPTQDWEYDYNGSLAHEWPNGVAQVPAVVGSVIRAKPHNGEPAGVTACFVAVKHA